MKPTAAASTPHFIENGLLEIFGPEWESLKPGLKDTRLPSVNLRESATGLLGHAETRGMILRAGRAGFYYWMREYAESLGWREVEFRLLPAPARINRALADALKWFEQEFNLKGELTSTPETWQITVDGLVDEDVPLDCAAFLGLLQELVCWAGAGKFYAARETACQADGASHCLIEITKQAAG